ncbi:hypothetical protein Pse7367_3796 (plasmid) [Thalassoporum mexicanum PCC 7367]|uniref:hypothetical protein n=1 Tax=Thalassoporum mexicanum TaxID=3457544 RepID=UPI00029FE7D4|nr:hypothetical protein [Pseudanabaena sp. PCC 7367]AFY72019.1 hypothetical protein Pse7367_3796 [Pseudanabaena sp. PCC 7367]
MSGIDPTPFLVLTSRQQYLPCHIKVEDIDLPMAAIAVGNDFYSYFRMMPKGDRLLKFILRLSYRGDRFVVTIAANCYLVWLYEPKAQLYHSQRQQLAKRQQAVIKLATQEPPCSTLFLISPQQYQLEDIRIKEMSEPLPGLIYAERTFSLLEINDNPDLVLAIVGRLSLQRHNTAILLLKTELASTFAICVQEPGAELVKGTVRSTRFLTSWSL